MLENDAGSRSSEGSLGAAGGGAGGGSGGCVAPQEIAIDASAGARRRESDGDRKGTIGGLQEGESLGSGVPEQEAGRHGQSEPHHMRRDQPGSRAPHEAEPHAPARPTSRHLPVNFAARRSTNDATPSRTSSLARIGFRSGSSRFAALSSSPGSA